MRAAKTFMESLPHDPAKVHTELRGSLSATGKGHATDRAVILGLAGWAPLTVPIDAKPLAGSFIPSEGTVEGPAGSVEYSIAFNNKPVPEHPNRSEERRVGKERRSPRPPHHLNTHPTPPTPPPPPPTPPP